AARRGSGQRASHLILPGDSRERNPSWHDGQAAAVGADGAGGAGARLDPPVAPGGGGRGAPPRAGGGPPPRPPPPPPPPPRVPPRAPPARGVDDARLARIAARLVLVAVVDHDLEAIRAPGLERHLPPHLRAVALVLEPGGDRVAAGPEAPAVLGGVGVGGDGD